MIARTNPTAQSEWPISLMLDELWLRARRVQVHALEAAGLWPPSEPHYAFRQEQWDLGNRLKSELVSQALSPDDYACFGSEVIFGPSNERFRARAPYALAFGYQLGRGFAGLLGAPAAEAEKCGRLAALFNLGVVILDLLCDNYPDLIAGLSGMLDEEALRELSADPEACRKFRNEVEEVASPELRILLAIIASFFDLRGPVRAAGLDGPSAGSFSLLLAGYQAAAAATCAPGEEASERLVDLGGQKAVLLFAIISRIARAEGKPPETEALALDRIAALLGEAFWHVNDLVDIVPDLQAGCLNAVLLAAGIRPARPWELSEAYGGLARLIDGRYVEDAATRLAGSLSSAIQLMESPSCDPASAACLRHAIPGFVRILVQ